MKLDIIKYSKYKSVEVVCVKTQHDWWCPTCCIRNSHLRHFCIICFTLLKTRDYKETKFMLVEGKGKVAPVQASKVYRRSRGVGLLIPNFPTRWR